MSAASAGLLFIAVLVWPITDLIAAHDVGRIVGPQRAAHLQAAREAVRTQLLTLGAGVFAAGALWFTAQNFRLSRQGQVTDRYTKAIEQLGSDKLDVRIGGIYALERVARDSARDHPTVMEVLAAFAREHSHEYPPPEHSTAEPRRGILPDVQAAATVIGRRISESDRQIVNLTGANLAGANLTGANLTDTNLYLAELSRANLCGANLCRADLRLAELPRANLTGANLAGANLTDANLTDANLTDANLTDANLSGADLTGSTLNRADDANLTRAILFRAYLARATFTRARLHGANLAQANLTGANLHAADLTSADLRSAFLSGADITGASVAGASFVLANLTNVILDRADLDRADLDRATVSAGVRLPAGWERDPSSGLLRRSGKDAGIAGN